MLFVGTIVLGLRLAGSPPWLQRVGLAPLLTLSTLGYALWVSAVAWHWLCNERSPR